MYGRCETDPFDQATARRFAACDGVTLICGRFEGVDG
mgnify:CR=1 FL=1